MRRIVQLILIVGSVIALPGPSLFQQIPSELLEYVHLHLHPRDAAAVAVQSKALRNVFGQESLQWAAVHEHCGTEMVTLLSDSLAGLDERAITITSDACIDAVVGVVQRKLELGRLHERPLSLHISSLQRAATLCDSFAEWFWI